MTNTFATVLVLRDLFLRFKRISTTAIKLNTSTDILRMGVRFEDRAKYLNN